jgi:hypothetical protein
MLATGKFLESSLPPDLKNILTSVRFFYLEGGGFLFVNFFQGGIYSSKIIFQTNRGKDLATQIRKMKVKLGQPLSRLDQYLHAFKVKFSFYSKFGAGKIILRN